MIVQVMRLAMSGQKKMELMTLAIVTAKQTLLLKVAKHMPKNSRHY